MDQLLQYFPRRKDHKLAYSDKIRKKYLSSVLPNNQKMELYNSSSQGVFSTFKELIEVKHYPLMEECSSEGYFWTSLHYATHYGKVSIVEYILDQYIDVPNNVDILNMQSNLGLSPLLIAIKNCMNVEEKKRIMELYVKHDCIDYDICSTDDEDIFDICQKQGLLEYFLSLIKED